MNILKDSVRTFHCPRWNELPQISLYMDQVLIVLEESLSLFSLKSDVAATSTMINNYVKQKLLAPPEKKKYGKEHIAYLIMIFVLKRELAMSEITQLMSMLNVKRTIPQIYDLFCDELELNLCSAFIDGFAQRNPIDQSDISSTALKSALIAFSGKLLLQNLLAVDAETKKPVKSTKPSKSDNTAKS
ncbi:MAG: DUF1836 domain-containing protein [Clostridia bacterium]